MTPPAKPPTPRKTAKKAPAKRRPPAKRTARKPKGDGEPLPDYKPRPEPWERRDVESTQAWAAFTLYRDQGLSRSTTRVAEELGKSTTLIHRWSRAHQWVIRVGAFDSHEDKAFRLEIAEARQQSIRDNLQTANAAMVKFGDFLDSIYMGEQTAEGKYVVTPGEFVRIAEVGLKLQLAALAQVAQPVGAGIGGGAGKPGDPGKTPHAVDLGKLSDEDRLARFRMLQRELAGRIAEREGQPVPEEDDDDE